MAIVLDAMGSDKYPEPEIQAAVTAAEMFGEEILLVGSATLLKDRLAAANPRKLAVRLVDAPDVLEMHDKPVESARKKPRNSMAVGLELVKTGEARAFVSAGNTGGVMFNALRTLGRIKGVARPALAAQFPVKNGTCIVLDIGANVDCRPEYLLQFAVMGSIYARALGKANPRVGLIANGEEGGKGNELTKETYPLLEKSGLNFIGNVEGKELFGGAADVAVTDGFVGNVMLKSSEAVAKLLTDTIKETIMSSGPLTKLGGALVKPALKRVMKLLDPSDVGAAPLLGIDGLVFVGHGRSDARALVSAIRVARELADVDLLNQIREAIQQGLAQVETLQSPS